MQDFTKQFVDNIKPLTQTKQDKWLNKDRLWNFVFWFAMSGGLAVAHFMRTNLRITDVAAFMYIITFLGTPLLLIIFNRTRFIKIDTFANSEGRILTKKQMPYMLPLAIISGIAFSVLISKFLPKNTNSLFVAFALSISVFSGLSLYFIFKNCPISILFNYKFWNFELRQGASTKSSRSHFSSSSSSNKCVSSSKYVTNPAYSNLICNVHHKR